MVALDTDNSASFSAGFAFLQNFSASLDMVIRNCVAVNFYRGHKSDGAASGNCTVENFTAIDSGNRGLHCVTANTNNWVNCVAYNSTTADFGTLPTGTLSTNASEDLTAPGTSPVTGVASTDFVDYAGGDYAAVLGGALDDVGTDLSARFADDITGTAR